MDKIRPLLELMLKVRASDLILTTGAKPQMRINGILEAVANQKVLNSLDVEELLSSVLTPSQIDTFKRVKEFDMSFGLTGISRFRLNAYFQRGSMGIAIRLVPFDVPKMSELGLPSIVNKFIDSRSSGLILISGPTGSGKSTTLSSMIEHINDTRQCHIITIEDPIEFIHSHKKSIIDQREVGNDTLSFQKALKHVLRETPDVIMIGEMRDLETIKTALVLAETGHLVLATLHTSSAANAISRIIDVFPNEQQQQVRVQLSSVLLGVVVQQLLPRRDKNGLVLACEVMNVNSAIRNLIRENSAHQIYSVIQTGAEYGMFTLNASLAKLIKDKMIDRSVAQWCSNDIKELRLLLN
ncbi:MAG: type IV pilus twitching motility protein PilT [Candidatus Omnitrophota bacterium]